MSTPTIPKEDATMSDLDDAKMEVEEDWRARQIRESSCGGNGGAGCNSQWCADCKQEEEVRDYLDEAERIVAGTSRLLPERAHLDALASALSDARFALQRITKREGRFSRDPLTHASNTVDDMAEIATLALAATRGREMGNGTSTVSKNER